MSPRARAHLAPSEFRTRSGAHLSPRLLQPTHASASPSQTHFILEFRHVAHDKRFLGVTAPAPAPAPELSAGLPWDRPAEDEPEPEAGDASAGSQVVGSGKAEVEGVGGHSQSKEEFIAHESNEWTGPGT